MGDVVGDYIRKNPTHEVSVCRNVQNSVEDNRYRVRINKLQRPYRPVTLGLYVVDKVEEAFELYAKGIPGEKVD